MSRFIIEQAAKDYAVFCVGHAIHFYSLLHNFHSYSSVNHPIPYRRRLILRTISARSHEDRSFRGEVCLLLSMPRAIDELSLT